ncbi:ABC transporter permease [Paenibacillus sp. TRM 82003]|nr:ABC transporter permease [Paenibacillus sp. TRM 82003]
MFRAQGKAESLRLLRSPFFLLFSLAMPIGFYFLFAGLNGSDTRLAGTTWGAYSLMSMTAFSLIGTAVSQFGIRLAYERKDGWMRLLKLTPLSTGVYIGSKIVSTLGVNLLVILILFPSAAVVYGLKLSAVQWLSSGVWLWLGSLPFLALGSLLGTMKSADASIGVGNVLLMGMAVLGGLWMPLETLPAWMQAIGAWLPSHPYAAGAWSILAGGLPSIGHIGLLLGYGTVFMVLSMYVYRRQEAI